MNDKQIIIPLEAIQVLLNGLVTFPYNQVAPILDQYSKLVEQANQEQPQ